MVSELDVSPIGPSRGAVLRDLLPSTGSLGSVPPLPRYYEVFRLPADHPASLRCLRKPVPTRVLRLRSSPRRARRREARGSSSGFPNRLIECSRPGLPGSWGTLGIHALLSDPGEPAGVSPGLRCGGAAFRPDYGVGARDRSFGALSHGLDTRCLRFAAGVTPKPRKTRYRRLARRCRAGGPPAGSHCKVSATGSLPPSPGLAWRTIRPHFFVPRATSPPTPAPIARCRGPTAA